MKISKPVNGDEVGEQFKRDILSMMWKAAERLGTEDLKAPNLEFDDILAAARKTCDGAERDDIRKAMRGCLDSAEHDLRGWLEDYPGEPADGRVLLCDHLRRIVSGRMWRNEFPPFHEAMETLDSDDGPFTIAFGDILELGAIAGNSATTAEATDDTETETTDGD